jgi:hypothetical protein
MEKRQKKTSGCPDVFSMSVFELALLLSHLCKALAAIDGAIRLRLKRNLCFAAAHCAGSGVILTGAAGCRLAGVTAFLAALGLVLEAALCIKLLLTGGENEFFSAFLAN